MSERWADAMLAAALLAVDPAGLGGTVLRARPGPARDRWLETLAALLPPGTPLRRLPAQIGEGRLLGGLDLAATLRAGRPVAERGLLAEADGGLVVATMAERLEPTITAHLAVALDRGSIVLERDGLSDRLPARFGVVALDEGADADERAPAALRERLALHLELDAVALAELGPPAHSAAQIAKARAALASIRPGGEAIEALCAAAQALGIGSSRAPLLALRVACAAAALAGRSVPGETDLAVAGRLALAPRAVTFPAETSPADEPPPDDSGGTSDVPCDSADLPLSDLVLAAVAASLPPDLLARLRLGRAQGRRSPDGRAAALRRAGARGRPAGSRRGMPDGGSRLNLVESLRAAAPWQTIRRHERGQSARRVEVRPEDFRLRRYKQKTRTTSIFVVDASGSAALNRLAEAKGAVELLLADCYVRRDRVALLAFRGSAAELLLPPTRSLVRAKRSLAGLPGGGGTPLAAGLDAALALAEPIRRRGETPVVILLTDGRANVARDGSGGRARAEEDALAAARGLRAAGLAVLVLDIAPQPQPLARRLAAEMAAHYLPMPFGNAAAMSAAAQAAAPRGAHS